MKVLKDILNSEKTNLGKLELVKQLEDSIFYEKKWLYVQIIKFLMICTYNHSQFSFILQLPHIVSEYKPQF